MSARTLITVNGPIEGKERLLIERIWSAVNPLFAAGVVSRLEITTAEKEIVIEVET
jgi:hypothetical protein